jgi:hypothetical protein
MQTVAIKITRESTAWFLSYKTPNRIAKIAFAMLTSAYNGENWYFVNPVSNKNDVRYEEYIMTEAALAEKFDYTLPDRLDWFPVTTK